MTGEFLKAFLSPTAPARLLEFFFLNPLGRVLQSDLRTDLELAPLRLFIPKLVQAGILLREEEGLRAKKVYYRANLDCRLFAELRALFLDYRRQMGGFGENDAGDAQGADLGPPLPGEGLPPPGTSPALEDAPAPASIARAAKKLSRLEDCLPLLGTSPILGETRRQIARLLPLDVAVSLRGESGSGKEGVARAIHESVFGASVRFFSVTCSSFSPHSLDVLLFGQDKGPVSERQPGLLGSSGGGTVFLREVQTHPLPIQRKLFRAMEERQYVPMDGIVSLPVNVRLVFGSSRDLAADVGEGTVLRELHSKLELYQVWIPPLRERTGDIPVLARHLLAHWCRKRGREVPVLEPAAELELVNRAWPGNIRELSDLLERTLHFLEGPSIGPSDLPPGPAPAHAAEPDNLKEARREFERRHVARVLHKCGNNKVEAARVLSVDLSTVYRYTKEP